MLARKTCVWWGIRLLKSQSGSDKAPASTQRLPRQKGATRSGGPAGTTTWLEGLREAGLKKLSELRCCPELRDGVHFLERRCEGIRQAPDRPRLELLILRLEVQVMHGTGKVFGSFEFALDERFVDDHLGRDVRQFTSLPGFDLLSHRLEVSLHPVDANRD